MKRPVSSLMRRDVCTVDMDDTMASVEKRLAEQHLSWVPVLQGRGAIIGVISAADVVRFHAEAADPESVRAWQMCTYKPISVGADTDLAEVARLMVDRSIHHVVVTAGGDVIGVLSSLDFVREFAERDSRDAAAA